MSPELIVGALVALAASVAAFFFGRKTKEVEQAAVAGAAVTVIAAEDTSAAAEEQAGQAEVGAKLDATLAHPVTPDEIDAALDADEAERRAGR